MIDLMLYDINKNTLTYDKCINYIKKEPSLFMLVPDQFKDYDMYKTLVEIDKYKYLCLIKDHDMCARIMKDCNIYDIWGTYTLHDCERCSNDIKTHRVCITEQHKSCKNLSCSSHIYLCPKCCSDHKRTNKFFREKQKKSNYKFVKFECMESDLHS